MEEVAGLDQAHLKVRSVLLTKHDTEYVIVYNVQVLGELTGLD